MTYINDQFFQAVKKEAAPVILFCGTEKYIMRKAEQALMDALGQIQAGHMRHADVRKNNLRRLNSKGLQRLLRTRGWSSASCWCRGSRHTRA